MSDDANEPRGASAATLPLLLLPLLLVVAGCRPDAGGEGTPDPGAVAIFPFTAGGAAGEELARGLPDLLALATGPDLRAVPARTALAAWREAEGAGDPEARARRGARAVGAGRAVHGSVRGGGGAPLVLTAVALETGGEGAGEEATVEASRAELGEGVVRLARELGLSPHDGPGAPLAARPAGALEAYARGRVAYRAGGYDLAADAFGEAVDADSTFGAAALELAEAAGRTLLPRRDAVERGIRLARARRGELSRTDSARLAFHAAAAHPRAASGAERLAAARRLTGSAPDLPEGWDHLGRILLAEGPALSADGAWREAGAALDEALRLDPRFLDARAARVRLAAFARDTGTVREDGEAYLGIDSVGDRAAVVRWTVARALGRDSAAARAVERFPELGPGALEAVAATAELAGFGLEDADRAVELLPEGAGEGARERALLRRYVHASNRGRPSEALAASRELLAAGADTISVRSLRILSALHNDGDVEAATGDAAALAPLVDGPVAVGPDARSRQVEATCALEQWRVGRRQIVTAERAAERLRRIGGEAGEGELRARATLCAAVLEATYAVARGRADAPERVAVLDSLAATVPPVPPRLLAAVNAVAATLHARREEPDAALEALVRRLHGGEPAFFLAGALRQEGSLAAAAGDRRRAILAYDHFLSLRAEPERSLYDQVRRVQEEFIRLLEASPSDGGEGGEGGR